MFALGPVAGGSRGRVDGGGGPRAELRSTRPRRDRLLRRRGRAAALRGRQRHARGRLRRARRRARRASCSCSCWCARAWRRAGCARATRSSAASASPARRTAVFVDGALWRARLWDLEDEAPLEPRRSRRGRARQRADTDRQARREMGGGAMIEAVLVAIIVILAVGFALAAASVRVLREYERAVVFRLGRMIDTKGPGLVLLVPAIDRMVRVSLRTVTLNVPPQDVITRDNVTARVDAVVYFRVVDPNAADRPGRELPEGHVADRPDDAALHARQGRPGHAAVRARAAQRGAAEDHRRADRAVGHQGLDRRDQGRRHPGGDAARDGAPGPGRARAAREGHQRRGRVPGRGAPERGRRRDLAEPDHAPAALPADAERDRRQPELDDRVPARTWSSRCCEAARRRADQAGRTARRATARRRSSPPSASSARRPEVCRTRAYRTISDKLGRPQWIYSNIRASSCSPDTGCRCPAAPPPPPSRRPSRRPTRSVIPASSRRRCRSAAAGRPAASSSRRTAPRPRSTPRPSSGWTSRATRSTRSGSRPRRRSRPSTTRRSSSTARPSAHW